jgi:hypothetical protein
MISYKSNYTPSLIIEDTSNIASNCNTVSFLNTGTETITITIHGTLNSFILTQGQGKVLGGRLNSIVSDSFDVTFAGGATPRLEIIKETISKY